MATSGTAKRELKAMRGDIDALALASAGGMDGGTHPVRYIFPDGGRDPDCEHPARVTLIFDDGEGESGG